MDGAQVPKLGHLAPSWEFALKALHNDSLGTSCSHPLVLMWAILDYPSCMAFQVKMEYELPKLGHFAPSWEFA